MTGQFVRLHQSGIDRPVVSAVVGACEKRVLAVERQRPDAALDGVGIQFDASLGKEVAEVVDDYPATFLPDRPACLGRLTTNVGLNGIKLRDARENVGSIGEVPLAAYSKKRRRTCA